jgi:hypothetical protein
MRWDFLWMKGLEVHIGSSRDRGDPYLVICGLGGQRGL